MKRRSTVALVLVAATLVAPAAAYAAKGGGGGGGGHGGGSAGPYSLKFYHCDGTEGADGFTRGTSVDGGGKAITLDGGNCAAGVQNNNPAAVGFWNFWDDGTNGKTLADVQAIKMSTQLPLTQGGSPRISIELFDGDPSHYDGTNNVFLDPATCGSPNGKGWINSDFTGSPGCTMTDTSGHTYANWAAMLADHGADHIWYAYVIADQPTVNRIDRITLDSQIFTS